MEAFFVVKNEKQRMSYITSVRKLVSWYNGVCEAIRLHKGG